MSGSHKLFVSFATDDNINDNASPGWVDDFVHYLGVYLQRINHESPEVVHMENATKRPDSLGASDGVVLIVSSKYLQKGLAKLDAPLLSDLSRVYKIDLEPIDKVDQPNELRSLNEFHFFAALQSGNAYQALSGRDVNQNYWLKIIDLAFEIDRTMYNKIGSANSSAKKVYLAETSYDQVHNRDEIKRELRRHGHHILPEKPFTGNLKEIEDQINYCLDAADLSVHIIGEQYGEIPEGSTKSLVEIQNQLSTEYFAKNKGTEAESLQRLIWMPLNLKARSDQQKLYLDQLKDDIASTSGAEIIQTPLEILKTVIHSRLQFFSSDLRSKSKKDVKRSEKKTVYLLFDKKDEKDIGSIVKDIESKNIKVELPHFDNQEMDFLESHRRSLVSSDAVLLFANNNPNWVNSKLNDVVKSPGFGKQFAFDAKAIFIKDSSIKEENIATIGDLLILNGEKGSEKNNIAPFLEKIASS